MACGCNKNKTNNTTPTAYTLRTTKLTSDNVTEKANLKNELLKRIEAAKQHKAAQRVDKNLW